VRILLAVESGSRAWGFPSPDSDFDVRFIYCRPQDWYLSVDMVEKRDVLEYDITGDIDLNGWDVRKALRLLARSNPTIVEWLQSPMQYLARGRFREAALELLAALYALRPLLAIRWIEHSNAPPPIEFRRLLAALEERPDLMAQVEALLEKKKAAAEMDRAPALQALNEYIESELARLEGFAREPPAARANLDAASALFRSLVREAWPVGR
jgi:predicted nucleotidyltransferase